MSAGAAEEAQLSLFQLLRPAVLADPYALYRRISEHERVHWDRFMNSWVVTGYAEAVTVLTQCRAGRTPAPQTLEAAGLGVMVPYAELMLKQILFMDPPDHRRVRTMCSAAFTPARIAVLRESCQRLAEDLLTGIAGKGEVDLLAEFASPFTATVLSDLIGLPREDSARMRRWGCDLGELLGNFEHEPDRVEALVASIREMRGYIEDEVRRQQRTPGTGAIAAMLEARLGSEALTFDEIVANVILLVGGGLEETANLIANGTYSLLCRPDQMQLLRAQPEIAASAVEEICRFESTTQYTGRVAATEMTMRGQEIERGQAITVVLAAANRDPLRFAEPDRLDLRRTDNRHLAFSWASHYCLGAPLARLAAQVAFTSLAVRFPTLALQPVAPAWRGMAAMRGLHALPVTL